MKYIITVIFIIVVVACFMTDIKKNKVVEKEVSKPRHIINVENLVEIGK